MNFNEYQEKILTFLSDAGRSDMLVNSALGLAGETGEYIDLIKKFLYHGHDLNKEKVFFELGDILFYVAEACEANGLTLQDVANGNIGKLTRRYPNGFSTADSIAKRDANG